MQLAGNSQAPLAPLLLDEWSLRRSERIFLSDTSPLPSPNLQPAKDSAAKAPAPRDSRCSSTGPGRPAGGGGRGRPPGTGYKQRQRANSLNAEKLRQRSHSEGGGGGGVKVHAEDAGKASASASGLAEVGAAVKEEKKDKDHAKVQKARSLQELTQRVKRKYNKNLCKKPGGQEEKRVSCCQESHHCVSSPVATPCQLIHECVSPASLSGAFRDQACYPQSLVPLRESPVGITCLPSLLRPVTSDILMGISLWTVTTTSLIHMIMALRSALVLYGH